MSRRHQGGRSHRANGNARQQAAPLAGPLTDGPRPRTEPSGVSRTDSPVPPRSDAAAEAPAQRAEIPEPAREVPADSAAPSPPQNGAAPTGCTAPQLRRFIKSRPYVPMHELRRRFAIDGGDDDVTPVALVGGRVYVGLPVREGTMLGELLRGGEIGYELSLDPRTPVVVGVYPMRPVPRP